MVFLEIGIVLWRPFSLTLFVTLLRNHKNQGNLIVSSVEGQDIGGEGQDPQNSSVLTTLYRKIPIFSWFYSKLAASWGKICYRNCPLPLPPKKNRGYATGACGFISKYHQLLFKSYLREIAFRPVSNSFFLYHSLRQSWWCTAAVSYRCMFKFLSCVCFSTLH